MAKIKILLVEDDRNLGMILKAFFDAKGHLATLCANGDDALAAFEASAYDICIADVAMHGMEKFALAKQIKTIHPAQPFVFLSSMTDQETILEAFKLGADDFVAKPFSMDELLMRVLAIYRRCSAAMSLPSVYQLGDFTFDAPRHTLTKGSETKKLTSKEADLLLLLCENMGNTLERSKALKTIWAEESYLNARSMDVYITKLRKFFKDEPGVDILNVHGVGFKLVVR